MTSESDAIDSHPLSVRYRRSGPMHIAITGASGLIGSVLVPSLRAAGHRITTLVRRIPVASAGEIRWDPEGGEINPDALEGVDAVVHLAGENIGNHRWTAKRKLGFIASRVRSTQLLSRALSRLKNPPRVLVSASAVGFYGNRCDEPMTESSAKGVGFLPDLCEAWENATDSASTAGFRVVKLRIGVVLTHRGGALQKLLIPFKLGLGGVMGSGCQYLSWISIDDVVGSICESVFNEELIGPVNATAPMPITNRELVKKLGEALHRPAILHYPAFAIKLLYGEMGQTTVLEGARVLPEQLQAVGFPFKHKLIDSVLATESAVRL